MDKLNKYLREREELSNLYNTPENRHLKYSAITIIVIVIILLLSITVWFDKISHTAMIIMRGCVGLGVILLAIIVGVLSYRIYRYYQTPRKRG